MCQRLQSMSGIINSETDLEVKSVRKIASLLLCLIIICSAIFASGCSKKTSVDVAALAEALCIFNEGEIDVERIEKMTIFRAGSQSWYVYKIHVTVHLEDGDFQDVLGVSYDPEGILTGRIDYASEKEMSYNGYNPSAGTPFVVWRLMEIFPEKCEISELSEKEVSKIVSRAWTYIEENNVHPEEED